MCFIMRFCLNDLVDKVLLFVSNASFGKTDIIFNLDISYYMFIKPLVEALLSNFVKMMIALSAYMAGYYIIIFIVSLKLFIQNNIKLKYFFFD